MTTTKSFSNSGRMRRTYFSALRRQVPFAVFATILSFVGLVLPYLVSAPDIQGYYWGSAAGGASEFARHFYTSEFLSGIFRGSAHTGTMAFLFAVLALACALVSARYLHIKRMTDLYHSLPITRTQLLISNLLASLTAILGPFLVLYLGTMGGLMIGYGRYGCFGLAFLQRYVTDFLMIALFATVVYLFTTFVCVNVGTTFDGLVLTGLLGSLPCMLYLIVGGMWSLSNYGSVFSGIWAVRLCPFLFYFDQYLSLSTESYVNTPYYSYWQNNFNYSGIAVLFLCWLLVAAALLFAAIWCYRRRRSELAGQTQAHGLFQTIGKCYGCFLGATIFLLIYFDSMVFSQILAMLFGAVLVGVIGELILSRSVKFMFKNLKWFVGAGVLSCVLLIGARFDITGYVTRIPAAEQVSSVTVNYTGRFGNDIHSSSWAGYHYGLFVGNYASSSDAYTLDDPASIAAVLDAHLLAVENRPENYGNNYEFQYAGLQLTYQLESGSTLSRYYPQVHWNSLLALTALETQEGYLRANNPLFVLEETSGRSAADFLEKVEFVDPLGNSYTLRLNKDQRLALVAALKTDLLAERTEELTDAPGATPGFLNLHFDNGRAEEFGLWVRHMDEGWMLRVSAGYTHTLAVLREVLEELPAPDLGEIESMELTSAYTLLNWEGVGVSSLYPSVSGNTANTRSSTYASEVTNDYAIDIAARDYQNIYNAGRTQILLSQEAVERTVVAVYYMQSGPVSLQYVDIDDLPASLREDARAMLDQAKWMYGYDGEWVYAWEEEWDDTWDDAWDEYEDQMEENVAATRAAY